MAAKSHMLSHRYADPIAERLATAYWTQIQNTPKQLPMELFDYEDIYSTLVKSMASFLKMPGYPPFSRDGIPVLEANLMAFIQGHPKTTGPITEAEWLGACVHWGKTLRRVGR